jgi:hypothetical protein
MAEVERLRVPAYHVLVDARELEALRKAVRKTVAIIEKHGYIEVDNKAVERLCGAAGIDYQKVMAGPQ